MIKFKKATQPCWVNIYVALILFIITLVPTLWTTKQQYLSIKIIFCISIVICIMGVILNSFDLKVKKELVSRNKYPLLLIIVGTIIFSPLLTDNFYFQDDYWGFTGVNKNSIQVGASLGRVFQGLLTDIFSFVKPSNNYFIRWFTVFFAIMFALVLYTWLVEKSNKKFMSFIFTSVICYSSAMADCTAYASIVSFTFALTTSAFSVVYFEKAFLNFKNGKKIKTFIFCLISILMIVCTYHSYQLAIPIIFLMFSILFYYDDDKIKCIKLFCSYIGLLIIASLIYIISNNIFSLWMNVSLNSRSSTITNISEAINKITWFIQTVLPASIDRIIAIFGGKTIILNKNYWYFLEYKEGLKWFINDLKMILIILPIVSISSYCFNKKKYLELFFLIFCIPASYCIYFILLENGYLTYYAYPLISVYLFYILASLENLFKRVKLSKHIFVFILLIVSFQCNTYIRQFWVEENKFSYEFIKNSIKTQINNENINKIHIYGVPNYGQANAYSKFATYMVLEELKLNPEKYYITVSDNQYYIGVIEENEFNSVIEKLLPEEANELKSYYWFDKTYSQYHIKYDFTEEKLKRLKLLLTKGRLLPNDLKNCITVDLTWISGTWENS